MRIPLLSVAICPIRAHPPDSPGLRWPPWTWLDDIPACARNSNRKETPMSITVEEKTRLIKEFGTKDGDTGSPEVQVAILTSRISTLTEHFKTHKKDNHGAPWPSQAGRPAPQTAGLPQGQGRSAVPGPDQAPGPASLIAAHARLTRPLLRAAAFFFLGVSRPRGRSAPRCSAGCPPAPGRAGR